MDYEAFSIQEFLGIILIGFPILFFLTLILLEFVARIRENFGREKQSDIFHHHYHYKDGKKYDRTTNFR